MERNKSAQSPTVKCMSFTRHTCPYYRKFYTQKVTPIETTRGGTRGVKQLARDPVPGIVSPEKGFSPHLIFRDSVIIVVPCISCSQFSLDIIYISF